MEKHSCDYLIIGAGVTGTALAGTLARREPKVVVHVLEKENDVALHTSGKNSGVVHAGFNQKPGTLKARLCVEGNRRLKEFCRERKVPLLDCGIMLMARNEGAIPVLEELRKRGQTNGVEGIRLLDSAAIVELEPHALGVAGLYVPSGATVDSGAFVRTLAQEARELGVLFHFNQTGCIVEETSTGFTARTPQISIRCRKLINCAGLYADHIAHSLGAGLDYTIIPFRGEFYYLNPAKAGIMRSIVYDTPDLQYPFLGIHWTRSPGGAVKVGPNAILALGREAYTWGQSNAKESMDMVCDPRFWKMAASSEFMRMLARNARTSLSKSAFLEQAVALIQGASLEDFNAGGSGIRAQIVDREGRLHDDILLEAKGNALHVLNAVSPGLTCSLPFAEHLADRLL
jgi:L-2-hydroxyglutarate oxidase